MYNLVFVAGCGAGAGWKQCVAGRVRAGFLYCGAGCGLKFYNRCGAGRAKNLLQIAGRAAGRIFPSRGGCGLKISARADP